MNLFMSYSSQDRSLAQALAEDLRGVGHVVWYDQDLTGGQVWWDQILNQIRTCDLFVFALTPRSLVSVPCRVEFSYAHDLNKRILPVLVANSIDFKQLPPALQAIQFVDYRQQDRTALMGLIKALSHLPPAQPLPLPLPAPPDMPVSPVGEIRGLVTDPAPLAFADQAGVLMRIKGLLASPDSAEDARDLLDLLRARHDLFAEIEHEIAAQAVTAANGGSGAAAPCKSNQSRFIGRLLGHTGIVRTAAFNPDGRKIVTASDDGTARVWNALTGQEVITLAHPGQRVLQASYSPEGLTVLTVGTDGVIRGWDPRTGEVDFKLDPPGDTLYQRAVYNPDGNLIVFVRQTGPNKTFAGIHAPMQLNHSSSGIELDSLIRDARYSPNGNTIAVALASGVAQTWTWSTIGSSWRLLREFRGHKGQVCSAHYSPDGTRLVTASYDGTARVWDAVSGAELMQMGGHSGVVWKAIYSPGGEWIVTVGEDSTLRLWEAETGRPLRVLDGHDDAVYTANFAPGGCILVTASADKTARVWDLSDLAEEA